MDRCTSGIARLENLLIEIRPEGKMSNLPPLTPDALMEMGGRSSALACKKCKIFALEGRENFAFFLFCYASGVQRCDVDQQGITPFFFLLAKI